MKSLKRFSLLLAFVILILVVIFNLMVRISEPEVDSTKIQGLTRVATDSNGFTIGPNWIRKNPFGLFEMYVEGSDFERGYVNGVLSQELVRKQEEIFVGKLEQMLSNKLYQHFLRLIVGWLNRNLNEHVDKEYLNEIFGVSRSASPDFDFVAPAYQRLLNYHAAHDIGHALQNMNLVACSSVGLWGKNTTDSSLIIGRNFDFYLGEEFAKEKIVLFVNPDKGYKFMSITWGGFIGVVSGMNEKGVTVTLNAAKSGIPGDAKTPVSIIGRKILQYSSNISEAFEIAKNYQSFVSESFMIGSKDDGKVAIIEKTPEKTTLFYSDSSLVTCTNHFQSEELKNDSLNIQNIRESPTEERRKRFLEIIKTRPTISETDLAEILRNRLGSGDKDLGMGNEKTLNQFVAHHSVIFNLSKGIVWVSANPYQLGAYVAYDLNKVFRISSEKQNDKAIYSEELIIPKDEFINSNQYLNLLKFKEASTKIKELTSSGSGQLTAKEISEFKTFNTNYFYTYMLLGDYFKSRDKNTLAVENYNKALTLDIPRSFEVSYINQQLNELTKKR